MPDELPAGIWRHVKGRDYLVIGVATDSNNVDPHPDAQVVYVSLDPEGRTGHPMKVRSLWEFLARFVPAVNGG